MAAGCYTAWGVLDESARVVYSVGDDAVRGSFSPDHQGFVTVPHERLARNANVAPGIAVLARRAGAIFHGSDVHPNEHTVGYWSCQRIPYCAASRANRADCSSLLTSTTRPQNRAKRQVLRGSIKKGVARHVGPMRWSQRRVRCPLNQMKSWWNSNQIGVIFWKTALT